MADTATDVKEMPTEARAEVRYARISPQKIERILHVIRNEPAARAMALLSVMPHSPARYIKDVLKSAIANATHNAKLNEEKLVVSRAIVGNAGMLKRVRAVSRGRAHPIVKKICHITVIVSEKKEHGKKEGK